ncbi:hypothetical protein [Streptomyces liangshanensis]|uniref:HEAT repeat domain-containing protein n=1 Tax=Streptomyces liangshanensis TaxID=2717324 RepID=A0A6G9GY45_9ACTN|nr:hypothetical protein [Streptomyces liangshanensis]QIQ03202.1 hypothetical protein HA039_13460 [Streptomyces liangshanensis]
MGRREWAKWWESVTEWTPEDVWTDFLGKRRKYERVKEELLGTDLLPVLRKALADGDSSYAVFSLVEEEAGDRPELFRELVPDLYPYTLSLGPPGIFSRRALRALSRPGTPHAELAPLVAATLRDEVTDVFAMRALAMLLEDVNDLTLLARWREAALTSPDEDVRELPDEYPESEYPPPDAPQEP